MIIKQMLISTEKYGTKCPYTMTPEGICVHNTANDATAKGEITYMQNNTNQTSFHIAVDDIEAWQGLRLDRNGWHAGDGNGPGNRKHIGIEICYSKSGGEKFDKAEENAAEIISQILKERNWGIDRVKKHQDFSGKYCPHRTLDMGWDRFINKIKSKMGGTMPTMYKGLDLTNQDSMKVAVDVWDEVINKKLYAKLADIYSRYGVESLEQLDSQIGGFKARITTLGNELGEAQAHATNYKELLSRKEGELTTARNDVKALLDRIEEAAETIEQLGKDKGNLIIQVEQLKVQIESLKAGSTQGLTKDSTLSQLVEWIKNLFWKN